MSLTDVHGSIFLDEFFILYFCLGIQGNSKGSRVTAWKESEFFPYSGEKNKSWAIFFCEWSKVLLINFTYFNHDSFQKVAKIFIII